MHVSCFYQTRKNVYNVGLEKSKIEFPVEKPKHTLIPALDDTNIWIDLPKHTLILTTGLTLAISSTASFIYLESRFAF